MGNRSSVVISAYDLGRLDQWCAMFVSDSKHKLLPTSLCVRSSVPKCSLLTRQFDFCTNWK
jgi:hypothetical protein